MSNEKTQKGSTKVMSTILIVLFVAVLGLGLMSGLSGNGSEANDYSEPTQTTTESSGW